MKIRFLRHISRIFWVVALIVKVQTAWGMCGSTVLWHNSVITEDVVDQNIDVAGVNSLVEGIQVRAETCDILITVSNGDAVITGSGFDPRLYLFADTDRTITFLLTDDLVFRGTAEDGVLIDLLISVSGPGEVRFCIEGNQSVSFTSTPTSGGTLLVIGMDDPNHPNLVFKRLASGDDNIEVIVGDRSCITYIAETLSDQGSTEEGCITFESTNTGTGCNILRLENNSSFVIWGHLLNASLNSEFLISDIDFSMIAGLQAKLILTNPQAGMGVPGYWQVINENCVLTNYLSDPFCDGVFTGTQKGFILGSFGLLELQNITYLDYIATKTNTVPTNVPNSENLQESVLNAIACDEIPDAQSLFKERNASAFIVDGLIDPNTTDPNIVMNGESAIYFRSGADCDGVVSEPDFTIDPNRQTEGVGNIVFDVEAPLNVNGGALNVLSLQVTKTGCPLFVESDQSQRQFPQRTFAQDEIDQYFQYNKGAFLINKRINFIDASLLHTDEIHNVYQQENLGRADLASEPTYIGGETFKLCLPVNQARPAMAFFDGIFRIHTNVGLTGVDLLVPNSPGMTNNSIFRFYNNGRVIDKGYGRVMILGTNLGSLSNCGQLIDRNTFLDIMQEQAQAAATDLTLSLDTSFNTSCITEGITTDISGQCAVHSIFMNNESNIQIGTNGDQGIDINTGLPFDLTISPSFCINGAFFSFDTAGGLWAYPEAGGTTGQGAIFVDANGTIKIQPRLRASFSSMVVRSRNGVINLPKNQVFFTPRVGITNWNVDLQNFNQQVLVPAGECLSDFTMDWGAIEKDYSGTNSFVPYDPKNTPTECECPPVVDANLRALPIVRGMVDQFQIKRSRIGDQAHLQVQGGIIRELVFLSGCNPGEFPGGFLVVEDDAIVGISTAHRNVDSLQASVKLGINGLMICANGNATIGLNENVLVDNFCPILTGTSFGLLAPQVLNIYSPEEHEFRIKSTGVLDLKQFDDQNKTLQFSGKVRVIFEPGAKLVLGGGTLIFTDKAEWNFQHVLKSDLLAGSQPSDLDSIRVKLIGTGFIILEEDSSFNLLQDQFFGIETDVACSEITSVTWILNDRATINIGLPGEPGGSFQIGNTACDPLASIDATFIVDGHDAAITINSEGFVGLGVGMADKQSRIPNLWLVNCLENINFVAFDIRQGTVDHRRISTGDSSLASLLAIGERGAYTFIYDTTEAVIRGGGNIVHISSCVNDVCNEILRTKKLPVNVNQKTAKAFAELLAMMEKSDELMEKGRVLIKVRDSENKKNIREAINTMRRAQEMKEVARAHFVRNVTIASINPIVQSTNGQTEANLTVGIMGGKLVWNGSRNRDTQPVLVSGSELYAYLVTDNVIIAGGAGMLSGRANFAENMLNIPLAGFVYENVIHRTPVQYLLGTGGFNADGPGYSLEAGAVNINVDTESHALNRAIQIRGAGSI